MKTPLHRLLSWLQMAEDALLVGCLVATFLALTLQVSSRYLFNYPLSWTEELARYLFVWTVFVGAAQVLRRGEHIAIGLLVERLPSIVRRVAALISNVMIAGFLAVLVVKGFQLADKVAELPSIALEVSMAAVYLALPLTAAVMLAQVVVDSIRILLGHDPSIAHRSL